MDAEKLNSFERNINSVTDEDVVSSQADLEFALEAPTGGSRSVGPVTESTPLTGNWRDLISRKAYDFIVRWETGGRAYYENVIVSAPVWPGYASGITIGCGYDLGYHTREEFHSDWESRLPAAEFSRLGAAIGFRTTQPNRDEKVVRAKQFVASLRDVKIPWDLAIEQFNSSKMPKLLAELYKAISNLDRLHPHCRGALLSLVFNRGESFSASGDRFREMRVVAQMMGRGGPADFNAIPEQIRAMKRIWGDDSSLAKRREGEALLFEEGLRASSIEAIVTAVAAEATAASGAPFIAESVESLGRELTADVQVLEDEGAGDPIGETAEDEFLAEAAGPTPSDVRWHSSDARQPDYAHLDGGPVGATFQLLPDDVEKLIEMNRFGILASPGRTVDNSKILLLLRGAKLLGGDHVTDVTGLTLSDQRPNHHDFRCVIGVYDRQSKKMTAFKASTVPNAQYVHKCFTVAANPAKWIGNILPTGCYTFTVGTHKAGKPGEIREVLRLSTTASGASQVVVLRSLSDVIYDVMDHWDLTAPADNIHPAQFRNPPVNGSYFSSAGCLTLPGLGSVEPNSHSGLWLEFRKALGIHPVGGHNGKQFSGVLLTGLDAAAAVDLRTRGVTDLAEVKDRLLRLRHGSRGAEVGKLQTALGLTPDDAPTLGPKTRAALIKIQQTRLGTADGILSPTMAQRLGLSVF